MPSEVSRVVPTAESFSGTQKLGHPVPLSNLVSEEKRLRLQPAQTKTPARCSLSRELVNGRSVASCRSTAYCSEVSNLCHSASVCVTGNVSAGDASTASRAEPDHAATPATPPNN